MVELTKKDVKQMFSIEHAQNIINHPINSKFKDPWKLPKDSEYKTIECELKKKSNTKDQLK